MWARSRPWNTWVNSTIICTHALLLIGSELQSTSTYLGDVPEVEEVVYFCGGRKHTCGDKIINLDGGLGHDIPKGLHILIKILQFLVDHRAKYPFDLALLGDQGKG